jgi:thiol-disulfide isomerase/thioredoxin
MHRASGLLVVIGALFLSIFLISGARAYDTKVVLAEDFTATWCGDCPNARCALEIMLTEYGEQLIVAEHHMEDILDNDWTNERTDLYGVGPIPHVQFDGKCEVVGAHSCYEAAEAYRAMIDQRLAETGGVSAVGISGGYWMDDETISLTATFRQLDPATLQDTEAHLLALEDDVVWQGSTYNHVTRGAHSEAVVLADVGDSITISAEFAIDVPWSMDQFECIAFLQRMSGDHEVYQSARLERIIDFDLTYDAPIILSLENGFGWYAEFRVAGDSGFRTEPVTRTLSSGEELSFDLRVFTGEEVRVGTGYLITQSENTGTTRCKRARVFNGSFAILVVDDDYVDATEEIITDALDADGYLYDLWSVFLEHLNQPPNFAEMKGYDVVIWHHGWTSSDLLTYSDVAALTAYMDWGGGLILSSQGYLSTTYPNTFTQNYLGVASWVANVGADEALGVVDDPISDGMDLVLEYPGPDANKADDVSPNQIGAVILFSEQGDRVALRADNETARSVFFAFGLNAMNAALPAPNNPATLIDRSIQWLISTEGTDVPDDGCAARLSMIRGIEPNPLAPGGSGRAGACIRFAVSERVSAAAVRLDVLDLTGRLVRDILHRRLDPGVQETVWDGRDAGGRPVAAGIYYLKLSTSAGADGAKLVVIR